MEGLVVNFLAQTPLSANSIPGEEVHAQVCIRTHFKIFFSFLLILFPLVFSQDLDSSQKNCRVFTEFLFLSQGN
jgi:hypothetical protein